MGLLTAERLPEETAIDRLALWADADLDELAAGQLRERAPSDTTDPLGVHGQLDEPAPWQRPATYWIEIRLILLRALFAHDV